MIQIYADNAATTQMSDNAIAALNVCLKDIYGNPSSLYTIGSLAAEKLFAARRDIAKCIGARIDEIIFTSGGTESDNQAIMTAAGIGAENGKRHIISQKTEHHAVLKILERLEKAGFEITLLDVDNEGKINAEQVENAVRDDTALVTVMMANNVTGTVMPVKEIADICRKNDVIFHTDAVQAVGHIPVDVREIGCDMLSISAHKFRGSKGAGALYCKKGITPCSLILGGNQENGARAGTENVGGICSMAAALNEAVSQMDGNIKYVSALRDRLTNGLSLIPCCKINGSQINKLPSIVNAGFEGIEGESLVLLLDSQGICCSAGSACNSGNLNPDYVLKAMGCSDEMARSSVRFSLSELNTADEVDYIVKKTAEIVEYLRSIAPFEEKFVGMI